MSGFAVDTVHAESTQSPVLADCRRPHGDLDRPRGSAAQIGGPQLAEALNEFHGYWNKRSNAMETSLRSLAQLGIRGPRAYREADESISAAASGQGGEGAP